ncbi:MAG: chalcone isomerase family protein [Vicingaceae bacterium]|nr:chalcone isomerase family protein [Vicingaceae bacterium]
MKNSKLLLLVLLILTTTITQAQITIGDVAMPKKVKVGETELELNGAGARVKLFMDMYVAGLYIKTKSTDAKKIVEANEHIAIKLQIVSSLITSDKMISAVNEGFKNSTNGKTASIQKEIDQFIGAFKDEIKKGDVFDIFYVPNKATLVLKNGKLMAKIEGLEFKKALFGIWLSDVPADKNLKKALLGK